MTETIETKPIVPKPSRRTAAKAAAEVANTPGDGVVTMLEQMQSNEEDNVINDVANPGDEGDNLVYGGQGQLWPVCLDLG